MATVENINTFNLDTIKMKVQKQRWKQRWKLEAKVNDE